MLPYKFPIPILRDFSFSIEVQCTILQSNGPTRGHHLSKLPYLFYFMTKSTKYCSPNLVDHATRIITWAPSGLIADAIG